MPVVADFDSQLSFQDQEGLLVVAVQVQRGHVAAFPGVLQECESPAGVF